MKTINTYWTIRHGQSENNVLNLTNTHEYGLYHLTETGKAQSREAAERLKPEGIEVLYASPFLRTKETAAIIGAALGLSPTEDARLAELPESYPDGSKAQALPHAWKAAPEGGGTYEDLYLRIRDFITDVEKSYTDKKILLVTHATPQNMIDAVLSSDTENEAMHLFLSVQLSAEPFRENGIPYKVAQ